MSDNWHRRDVFTGAAALALAVAGQAAAQPATGAAVPGPGAGDPERNKRFWRQQREISQMHALPSALPGAGPFEEQTPLSGQKPDITWISNDSPLPPGATREQMEVMRNGFPATALSPTFLSYGPMLAEGDVVVEEFESQIYGGDGTLYNNQYLTFLRFGTDRLVEFREYNDTHHAFIAFGRAGHWPELKPPTNPRRRARGGVPPLASPTELESAFVIVDAFDLDPKMLCDVHPSAAAPPVRVQPGPQGNKALVRALRHARASGDQAVVNSFFAPEYRHFVAGEPPFGWDHLPFEEVYAPLAKHLVSPLKVRYGPLLADGDRVFEEMDIFGRLDDGTVYNNWHAYIHEIRDGRIVQTREYTDTRHVWIVLGRWAAWGATPVAPRSRPRRSNLQAIAMTSQIPTQGGPHTDRWQPFPSPPRG